MKNHNGPRSRSRTPTPRSRAGALIGCVLAVSNGIPKAIDTRPYPPTGDYRAGRSADGAAPGVGEPGGRGPHRHCKLTVIALNVTRVLGRIKVNCSKWCSVRSKKRSQLALCALVRSSWKICDHETKRGSEKGERERKEKEKKKYRVTTIVLLLWIWYIFANHYL